MALPVSLFSSWKKDLPASIVVLLVALPLCLGIALGSSAPLFSGIIAGILGGVVVGLLSKSNLSVTGPAAGLTVIISGAITQLKVYEAFLMAVVIAGALQVLFGIFRAGVIGDYVPNSVIKGMLAAIGLILILKQLPFLVGYEADYEGDERFLQNDRQNTFSEIGQLIGNITPTALVMGLIGIGLMVIWESRPVKKIKLLQALPAPLLIVLLAATANEVLLKNYPELSLQQKHMVILPIAKDLREFAGFFTWPDFNHIYNIKVWTAGFTIAIVASLETLLSIEAVDKLDPLKRITPTNKELKAQGIGNMISGLLGGLPMTSVVVRSSAGRNFRTPEYRQHGGAYRS
jgi:MFS superfamily sulfate permease-like transporter